MKILCTASQLRIVAGFYLTEFFPLCGGFSIFSYGSNDLEMLCFGCRHQHQASAVWRVFSSYFLMLWGGSAISQSTTQPSVAVAANVPVSGSHQRAETIVQK